MEARGGTAETRALEEAAGAFARDPNKKTRRRIFLVSDGLERGGHAPLEDAKKTGSALAAAGVECVAFAVGSDADLEFLAALTLDGKNGRAVRVEEASSLSAELGAELERGAIAPGGNVVIHRPAGAPVRVASLPAVRGVARTRVRDGALGLASVESGIPLFAWSASARVAAMGVAPGSDLAPNYVDEPDLWRSILAALAPPNGAPSATLEGDAIAVDAPSAGEAGSLTILQGRERTTLWRDGACTFRGPLGSVGEGWAEARAGARSLGPLFLARPVPIEAAPWLRAAPWPPLRDLAAPRGAPWRVLACVASILLLVAGAAAGWWPRRTA
jgi:hypothetical protein